MAYAVRPRWLKDYHLLYLKDMKEERPNSDKDTLIGWLSGAMALSHEQASEAYEYWLTQVEWAPRTTQ